jgi:hypothetical protein
LAIVSRPADHGPTNWNYLHQQKKTEKRLFREGGDNLPELITSDIVLSAQEHKKHSSKRQLKLLKTKFAG